MEQEFEPLFGHKVALTSVYGCHNPETHDFNGGYEMDTFEIKQKLATLKNQDGITLSGGDPFFQAKACAELAMYCKQLHLNVWCYTGFTFESLLDMSKTNAAIKELLESTDVLVDGKFEQDKKSLNLYFRGSSNQRILNIPQSLVQKKAIELEEFNTRKISSSYSSVSHISKHIFI